jgi:hypothetical protein
MRRCTGEYNQRINLFFGVYFVLSHNQYVPMVNMARMKKMGITTLIRFIFVSLFILFSIFVCKRILLCFLCEVDVFYIIDVNGCCGRLSMIIEITESFYFYQKLLVQRLARYIYAISIYILPIPFEH